MAYKPYKVNTGEYEYKKESKYQIERLKLFGFRSGIAWKMIPALFYYLIVGLILYSSIVGEIREFKFEEYDYILLILKYIFLVILLYSPAIFLSDFKYNKKMPIFKNGTLTSKFIGMAVVIVMSLFFIWTYQFCMSSTYKESAEKYYRMKKEQKASMIDKESENTETVSVITETGN